VAAGPPPVVVAALTAGVTTEPAVAPLRARLPASARLDSTTSAVAAALAAVGQGGGGRLPQGRAAARKRRGGRDRRGGRRCGSRHDGRRQDPTAPALRLAVPGGARRVQDGGAGQRERRVAWEAAAVCAVTRLTTGGVVPTADGRVWARRRRLAARAQAVGAEPVVIGGRQRLAGRLLAVRAPPPVAAGRRRPRHAEAPRQGRRRRIGRRALADGSVRLTTVPADRRTVAAALVVRRARWQSESEGVGKRWPDAGPVDASGRATPWRRRGAVSAQLVAMVVPPWLLITTGWTRPAGRFRTAAAARREEAPAWRWAWGQRPAWPGCWGTAPAWWWPPVG
jgi:hypothetical protein